MCDLLFPVHFRPSDYPLYTTDTGILCCRVWCQELYKSYPLAIALLFLRIYHQIHHTHIHNDEYKKIALFKPTNKIIASTGDNDFNGKNLTALVNECKDEDELKRKLLPYETTLYIFSVENEKIYMEIITFHDKMYSVTKNCVSGRKEMASFSSSLTVTNFLKPILVNNKYYDKTALAYINAIYDLCMSVPDISDNTIGGDIRILKITPDGFTWLQNGYEL